MYCPIPNRGGRWRLPGVHGMIRRWANRLDWRGGISKNVMASMTDYGLRDVACIRPALDTDRFAPGDATAIRRELGLAADDLVVLFVGNAKPQKNMLGALRAIQRVRQDFPRVKLIVTTELKHSSSHSDLAHLSAEISRLGLESSIIQKGIVNDMPGLMRACDVLVAPFLDSFGPSDYFMAVLEAMACGKPVVVADVGGMSEVVSDEVGRLVDPRDDAAIAQALAHFLADRELRQRVGANARQLMQREFLPDSIVAAYRDVYRSFTS
jgi:glycosyltransferase involved in cell wall biosynthesis